MCELKFRFSSAIDKCVRVCVCVCREPLFPYVRNKQGIDLGLHPICSTPKAMTETQNTQTAPNERQTEGEKKRYHTYSASDGIFIHITNDTDEWHPFEMYKYPKASR